MLTMRVRVTGAYLLLLHAQMRGRALHPAISCHHARDGRLRCGWRCLLPLVAPSDRLQAACSSPRYAVRSSVWPRWMADTRLPLRVNVHRSHMGCPHLVHESPGCHAASRIAASFWCVGPYPRAVALPCTRCRGLRLRSYHGRLRAGIGFRMGEPRVPGAELVPGDDARPPAGAGHGPPGARVGADGAAHEVPGEAGHVSGRGR
jgi:hypothetical protein